MTFTGTVNEGEPPGGLAEAEGRAAYMERVLRGALARAIGGPITILPWHARHAALDGAATVVNTTSCGMVGQPSLRLVLDALRPEAVVADIVSSPLETELIAGAKARGNRAVGGLGMLLHQGPPAWKLWFGLEPKVTPEIRRMMEASIRSDG